MRLKSLVGFCFLALLPLVHALGPNEACNLPQELQSEIVEKYSGAKVVSLSDLDEDDRGFFQKDHGDACPGFTKVDFYGDGKEAFALVLITKTGPKEKSEDPSGFGGGKNFYRYVNNSPTGSVDPLGLARCSYSVSGGMLICFPQEPGHDAVIIPVASGNNGDGMQCKNNPSCDPLHNRGPIPRGNWQWTTDPTSKPNGRVLVPMPGTMTWVSRGP